MKFAADGFCTFRRGKKLRVNKLLALLGDPQITAYLYCNFAPVLERFRDLQNIFALTYGSPGIYQNLNTFHTKFIKISMLGFL